MSHNLGIHVNISLSYDKSRGKTGLNKSLSGTHFDISFSCHRHEKKTGL